jgi:hypothetical protein
MPSSTRQHAFPAVAAGCALVATTGLIMAAGWMLPVTLRSLPADSWRQCLTAAGVICGLSALLGVAPVALLGHRGVMAAAAAYFLGMGMRLIVCLGAAAVVSHAESLSGPLFAAALALFYLPLLAVEVAYVGRYLWQMDLAVRPPGPAPAALGQAR